MSNPAGSRHETAVSAWVLVCSMQAALRVSLTGELCDRLQVVKSLHCCRPGTTEAIELGCTCRVIAHQSATDEAEPAEMLTVPDANCPLHAIPTRPNQTD